MERKQYRAHGRDLYADLECTCRNERWVGTDIEHLMSHTIKLTGYADGNFFDNVNAEPQTRKCKCGREYFVQWFRDGVEAEFLDAR